jgi:enoyl-CoA hydratase/carnithine racemase
MEERLIADRGTEAEPSELLTEVRNGVARVTLNRPTALNALTFGMLKELTALFEAWATDAAVKLIVLRGAGEKAFCAGGDVRALYEAFHAGRKDLLDFFIVEYALDHRIHTFPKPIVAVMDGIVMGGGMGLAQGAALRIATDRTKMAMPETAIGLFPDVGGGYFLPRCPGQLGAYLGLAGPTIRAADAIYAGLADTFLASDALHRLDTELETATRAPDPRTALRDLAQRLGSQPPAPAELAPLRDAIDTHFGQRDAAHVLASLQSEARPVLGVWAQKTLAALERKSPTALAVAFEQLARGKRMSLGEDFRMELGLIQASFEHGDFLEGIRALIVDKDNAPQWNPPRLDGVTPALVDQFFAPRWSANEHPLAHLK